MVQVIEQKGDFFGRLGSGFGKGMAEQLPKEIERSRLTAGLKKLGEQKDLSPFERFTGLVSAAHEYPQIVQSGSDLLKQEARGQALNKFKEQPKTSPFPNTNKASPSIETKKNPTLTKEEDFAKAQEGFIPRTEDEKFAAAGARYNANPALFPEGPQQAIDYENKVDATNESRAAAHQTRHQNLTKIQDNVVARLLDQSNKLNTKVPADLYSEIEDKAILATKPKKDGGGGVTEDDAKKTYGKELDEASRKFEKIKTIGNWEIALRPAKESLRALNELQNEMEKLNQTDNFAHELISKNKLSPMMGFAIAEKVSRVPELNSFLKKLPDGNKSETLVETVYDIPGTAKIAPELAKFVKDNEKASPLAIAYELQKKGYDASTWLQYLTDHAKELNLRTRQSDQAATPINTMVPWNDWWLSSFTGIE